MDEKAQGIRYELFADCCEGGEPQQFASVELLHQEDDQMIEEIVDLLNENSFRDCLITWALSEREAKMREFGITEEDIHESAQAEREAQIAAIHD